MLKNLKIYEINSETNTSFQKCIIPKEFLPETYYPGCLAQLNYENGIINLCRLFSMNNLEFQKFIEIDPCVYYYKKNINDFYSIVRKIYSNVSNIVSVKVLEQVQSSFQNIKIEIFFKNINTNIKLTDNLLKELIKDILKCYKFSKNCIINIKNNLLLKHGISHIGIISTDLENHFGTIYSNCSIDIVNKYYLTNQYSYVNLKGIDDINEQLNVIIKNSLDTENSQKSRISKQILITGPSGVGKTSIIRNLSLKKYISLYEIEYSDILRPHPGETEMKLRDIFDAAIKFAESQNSIISLIAIENLEQFCPKEIKTSDQGQISRISSQLINLLDKINGTIRTIVIATTSNIENINLKVRRAGRMEIDLFISLPTVKQRSEIIESKLNEIVDSEKFNCKEIAKKFSKKTPGYVGADLSLLLQHISRQIWKENKFNLSQNKLNEFFENALKSIRPSCLRDNVDILQLNPLNFQFLGGVDRLKKILDVSILKPLENPESFARFNLQPPKGILLYGPPGCAKTTIAKYLAAIANMTFISVSSAEIYSPYVGNAEKFIVKLFNRARMSSPSILFLDEIDALVGNRSKSGKTNDVQTRVLSTLLTEMDGIGLSVQSSSISDSKETKILVMAATNRPDMIDDALMRPGRFDKLIHVSAPDLLSRYDIFRNITKNMPISSDVDFIELSNKTHNFSGADIKNLCNEAALSSLTNNIDCKIISKINFETALSTVKPSLTKLQISFYYEFEKNMKK